MSDEGSKNYIPQILVGIIITVVGGLLLAFFSNTFNSPGKTTQPKTPPPSKPQALTVYYQLSGRSVILGPNEDDGVWASKPGATNQYYWHEIHLQLTNDCDDYIFIDSDLFYLYISADQSIDQAERFSPTREGLEFQKDRIPDDYIKPGASLSGILYYRVPQKKLSNGTKVDSAYNIVRYSGSVSCKLVYNP